MTTFFFSQPWMLLGLALVAVPFLIHWYFPRRKPRVIFPTLAFFNGTPPLPHRSRLQHLGLAVLRALVIAVVVVAFAQPYLSAREEAGRIPAIALILDVSLSTRAETGRGSRFDLLKTRAVELLRQMPGDTQVMVIASGTRPRVLQEGGSRDTAIVSVESLRPTEEDTDLEASLQTALQLLGQLGPDYEKEVIIFSDFQRSSARHLGMRPLPEGLRITLVPVGETFVPNAAVSEVRLVRGMRDEIEAVIANHSDRPLRRADLELWLDGSPAQTREIDVPAFGSAQFRFPLPALTPGVHRARMVLTFPDALPDDNVREIAFEVSPPIHTLVLEAHGDRSARDRAFFFQSALIPAPGSVPFAGPGFTIETVTAPLAAARLARPGQPAPRIVVVPPLARPGEDLAAALFTHVAQGGGVVFFVGPGLPYAAYNEVFRDILPALMEGPETAASVALKRWKLGAVERTGIFQPFEDTRSGDLSLPEFNARFKMLPVEGAQLAASFEDGTPAVVTLRVGEGRSVLVNTTLDAAWTDWPKRRSYLPFVHGLTRFLAREDASAMAERRDVLSVSDHADVRVGLAAAGRTLQLAFGDEPASEVVVGSDGWLRGLDLSRSGFYFLRDREGREVRVLAVVNPQAEQDLSSFTPAEIESRFTFRREDPSGDRFTLVRPEFWGWQWLLALASLLVLVELAWANRTAE
ncbi:MAG: BatA and WFA domain-containing protein [Verrucomicrobiia bacterium]